MLANGAAESFWWWSALAALTAVPIGVTVCARGRAWLYCIGGGAAWWLAVLAKLYGNPPLQEWLLEPAGLISGLWATERRGAVAAAIALGAFSALAELGLAAPLLLPKRTRVADAVALGLGAGLFELFDTLRQGWEQLAQVYGEDLELSMLPKFGAAFLLERAL